MREKKQRADLCMKISATFLTTGGTALCLAGLLQPKWYKVAATEGNIGVTATLGLWQDEICNPNTSCQTYWLSDDTYSRPEYLPFPSWKLIQAFETVGTAIAVLSVLCLVPLWVCYRNNTGRYRIVAFVLFYIPSMIAGFLCIIGCLIISRNDYIDHMDYAPLLSGIGGSMIFTSVCMSCAVCRYDPTYGTLENPVSPRFSQA